MKLANKSDVIAEIRMLPTEEGGRKSETSSDIFRCIIDIHIHKFSSKILIGEKKSLKPGQAMEVGIKFLDWDYAKDFFQVGTLFDLWDMRKIGEGRVIFRAKDK